MVSEELTSAVLANDSEAIQLAGLKGMRRQPFALFCTISWIASRTLARTEQPLLSAPLTAQSSSGGLDRAQAF